jgi:hypothetical protein
LTGPLCRAIQKDSNELCFVVFRFLDNFLWILEVGTDLYEFNSKSISGKRNRPMRHVLGCMDPAAQDQWCAAWDPPMAHYNTLAMPSPDGLSNPLGPADAHRL